MKTYQEAKVCVDSLNLFWPLRKAAYLHKWDEEKAANIEAQYRQFFAMIALDEDLAPPNADVDDLWHEHILNTRRYARDCEKVHGKFIHHSSMDGVEESARTALVARTVALFQKEGLAVCTEPLANCCCGGSCKDDR
jgi:hypothetical protein